MIPDLAILETQIAALEDEAAHGRLECAGHLTGLAERLIALSRDARPPKFFPQAIQRSGASLGAGQVCATPQCKEQATTLGGDGLPMCGACWDLLEGVER